MLCPLCGRNVPSDVDRCPFCSTHIDKITLRRELDKVIEKRLMRKLKPSPIADAPAAPVPSAPIPEVKVTCPGCGLELSGGEVNCTRCGIPLATEEAMLECPECGTTFAEGAKACPKCGVGFERGTEESLEIPPEPLEAPRPRAREVSAPEVVTSLPPEPPSMPRGLTNGRGAINGTGLVNGTGMINGTKGDARPSSPARRRGLAVARWQFLAVLVALVIIIPTFVYLSYSKDSSPFSVDGDFGEWDGADTYSVEILTESPLTLVDGWSVAVDGNRVYLYASAFGNIFGTTSVESLLLFIDSDGDDATGYSVGTMGAEYLLELDGWNLSVQASELRAYAPEDDVDAVDWSSWESLGGVASRLEGRQLEAMGVLQEELTSSARFLLFTQDQLARRAMSAAVPAEGGVLMVEQGLSASSYLSGLLPVSESAPILTLTFTCDGGEGTVDSLDVQLENLDSASSDFEPFSIGPDDTVTVEFQVETTALSSGQFVSAFIESSGIGSSFASVVVTGHPARAYVGASPSVVRIDGAFGDWNGRTASDSDLMDVVNANIDVDHVGVFNTSQSSSFFISVEGEICIGSFVPMTKSKPVPGGGGSTVATRKTGEDVTRIYIDSDMSSLTGHMMSVESKVIGADYRIEVRGMNGEVVSAVLHSWTGSLWGLASDELDAEIDRQRMEVSVLSYSIGGAVDIDFIIETTDWRQNRDYVALDEATMLAITGGLSSVAGTLSWAVDDSTSTSATSSSYQRKIFHDGTNFWSFYFDGSNTMYKYSSDGGVTWSSPTQAFTTSGVLKVGIWYDSGTSSVYLSGDTSTATQNIYLRKGTVTPSPASISWGTEVTFDISTTNYALANKNSYIMKNASGTVWVSVSTKVHPTQEQYNLRTASTSSGDDITGAWTDRGNLAQGVLPDANGAVTLLPGPLSNGIACWAIYSHEGGVYSRTHSGSVWSSPTEIHAPFSGTTAENTIYAPPSALVDDKDVVHVVYGTSNMNAGVWDPDIQYTYSTASDAWSTRLTLNGVGGDVHKFPTISLDSSTGNVYVMWVEDGSSADNIEVMKNVTGTWTTLSVPQTTYVKTWLTSIYSAPGETYICWQWTQNASSPDIIFDKIPEFSDAVLPVLFVLTVFIAVYRRRSRPEDPA